MDEQDRQDESQGSGSKVRCEGARRGMGGVEDVFALLAAGETPRVVPPVLFVGA